MLRILWAALLAASTFPAHAADLVERGQYDWTEDDPNFGGMSGLWIAPGGERLIAISDRGYFARAKIERSNKVITNIKADEITPIPLVKDRPTAFPNAPANGNAPFQCSALWAENGTKTSQSHAPNVSL